MTKSKGKFIVIEGIDGAGTETQTKLIFSWLKKKKRKVELLSYPDYKGPIGRVIHRYLHQKYNFSVETLFLLFFLDFLKDKEKIKKWKKEGKIIIADRYFTSSLAYQGVQGFSKKKALFLAEFFDLPIPDLSIYLKISPKTSLERKKREKKSLDINEKNFSFLKKVKNFYEKKLIPQNVFTKWTVLDGEKSKKEVFEEIKNIISKLCHIEP